MVQDPVAHNEVEGTDRKRQFVGIHDAELIGVRGKAHRFGLGYGVSDVDIADIDTRDKFRSRLYEFQREFSVPATDVQNTTSAHVHEYRLEVEVHTAHGWGRHCMSKEGLQLVAVSK